MKVSSGEYVLLDIMLCAVGCLLMVTLACMVQDRAPGIHPKPLSLVLSAVGSQQAFDVVEWQLRRPDGEFVSHEPDRGIVQLPSSEATRTAENQLYLVSNAMEGEWLVYIRVKGGNERKARYSGFAKSLRTPVLNNVDNQLRGRYLETLLRGRDAVATDVQTLLQQMESNEKRIVVSNGKTGLARDYPELEAYVGYRTLTKKYDLIRKHGGDTDNRLKPIEESLQTLITSTIAQAAESDKMAPILEAIQLEERLREEMPKQVPIWAAEEIRRWLKNSRGSSSLNNSYRRNLLIALRMLTDYVADPSFPLDQQSLREVEIAADWGKDIFSSLLVAEAQMSMDTDTLLTLSANAQWGDESWPGAERLENGKVRMSHLANGSSIPIARLTVDRQDGISLQWQTPER